MLNLTWVVYTLRQLRDKSTLTRLNYNIYEHIRVLLVNQFDYLFDRVIKQKFLQIYFYCMFHVITTKSKQSQTYIFYDCIHDFNYNYIYYY